MLQLAEREGITHLLATPHATDSVTNELGKRFLEQFGNVKKLIADNNIKLEISLASELFYCDQINGWLQEPWATFNGNGKYFLFELPLFDLARGIEEFIFEVRLEGKYPILAHPERYHYMHERIATLFNWRNQGCLMQLNAGSITGQFGNEVKKTALRLLEKQFYHFCASDAHDPKNRSYSELVKAREIMKDVVDESYLNELFRQNPQKAIAAETVIKREIIDSPVKRGWQGKIKNIFSGLFGNS